MKSFRIGCVLLLGLAVSAPMRSSAIEAATAKNVDVVFLTPSGATVLMSWTPEMLEKLGNKRGEIPAQKLVFDESTKNLELNSRADIDLITLRGENGTARVPRFMVWRGFLKFQWDKSKKTLRSTVSSMSRLLVPADAFKIDGITKIELAQHAWVYPGTGLKLRTNPAASRGEKLFTQNCMACHSLPNVKGVPVKGLKPEDLTSSNLEHFSQQHHAYRDSGPNLSLDAKAIRGLIAYSQALASVKNEVKSQK